MHGPSLNIAALSDFGRIRKNNEDSFAISDLETGERLEAAGGPWNLALGPRGCLIALSDGMGGHQAGEVASALVVGSLHAGLLESASGDPPENRIASAVARANADVLRTAEATGKRGMGATLTALLLRGDRAWVAQVGDSRAYLLRRGRLRQLTRDQSLVQLLVDQGALTPEEARGSVRKNVLLQAIGTANGIQVAVGRMTLRRGDRFLLCCDGLSNAVEDDELGSLVGGNDPGSACRKLVDLANDRGGRDNLTAIVAHVDGDVLEEPGEAESLDDTIEILSGFSTSP
jgi:PPM family protein phosphatase